MQKSFLFLLLFFLSGSNVSTRTIMPEKNMVASVPASDNINGEQLFDEMQLMES